MMKQLLIACALTLAAQAALAQQAQTDWSFSIGAPSGWTLTNKAVTGTGFSFSIVPNAPPPAAIAFQGQGTVTECETASCSATYTVNVASNALLVNIAGNQPACFSGSGVDDLTSVTFDGVAATLLAKRVDNIGQRFHYVYGLLNPHVGAHTVTVVRSGTSGLRFNEADYSNVSGFGAATPHDHGAANCGTDTTLTTSLTTTAPNSWIYLGLINSTTSGPAAGAGLVYRGAALDYVSNFDSGGPIATPGAHSMTTTSAGSGQSMSHVAVELKN
jgi:hypothetical protein